MDVQLGLAMVTNLQIFIALVVCDGLLSMAYLIATDDWVGMKERQWHMDEGAYLLSERLRVQGGMRKKRAPLRAVLAWMSATSWMSC